MVYSMSHVDGAEMFVFFYVKTVLHFLIDKRKDFFHVEKNESNNNNSNYNVDNNKNERGKVECKSE